MDGMKVIKGKMGYKACDQDSEFFTHVIFSKREYKQLESEKASLLNKIREMESQNETDVKRAETDTALEYSEVLQEYQKIINDLNAKIPILEEKARLEENKNQNLIRIFKERANAKRGLAPKKEHSGYIILSAEEFIYVYRVVSNNYSPDTQTLQLPCWRTRLQTPYSVNIDPASAANMIYDDIINVIGILMGISKICNIAGQDISTVKCLFKETGNIVFKSSYRANAVKGFWEVEYLTKDFITISPEMLPTANNINLDKTHKS